MGDYSRQLALLGKKGQQKLERASAAIVGCGGLGSHVAVQLARSGVGKLLLIDPDNVERSNLHRVMIFTEKDIGKPKAKTLSEKLRKAVGSVEVDYKIEKLGKENTDILKKFDVVIDCSDNMKTRSEINEFCFRNKIPWVHGSCVGTEGFVASFRDSPCFSCLFRGKLPYHCDTEGIIMPTVGVVASLQAMEVLKILTGISKPLYGKLLAIDLENIRFDLLNIQKRKKCEVCG